MNSQDTVISIGSGSFGGIKLDAATTSHSASSNAKSVLETELRILRERIDYASLSFEQLIKRLSPILKPCQTLKQETFTTAAPKPLVSPIVDAIQTQQRVVECFIDKMKSVNDRLDT